MDSQYLGETFLIALRTNFWMFLPALLFVGGVICWQYRKPTLFFYCLPILLMSWGCFEATGQFSSYDMVKREGALIYNQEQYTRQMDEWVKEVDDSNGRWVSMVACPGATDNGTRYLWAEFAYQPGKAWYKPIGWSIK
jgi:hypothetical protein